MRKNLVLLGFLVLFFASCTGVQNAEPDDSQDGIYKKAVLKLVKEQNRTYRVDQNIVDYSKEEK